MNSLYSVTGQPAPPTLFPPGTSGFTVSQNDFFNGTSLSGVWSFLGQQVAIPANPLPCADRALPGQCDNIDPSTLKIPFDYTRSVILKLSRLSIAAARDRKWKAKNGRFVRPFLSRGASALTRMTNLLNPDDLQPRYSCQVAVAGCVRKTIPKQELIKAFSDIFTAKVPKGLNFLVANAKKEIAAFKRELRKVPDHYTECNER